MAIFTALTALFSAIGFSAVAASFIARTLIQIGLSLAFGALNKPKETKRTAIESEGEFGADVPVSAVYGKAKLEGHLVHYNKNGKGNKYNQFVKVLSNGWCDGLEPYVIIEGEKKDLVAQATVNGEIARYFVDGYGSAIDIRFYDGRPGQAADPAMLANANPAGNWTADDTLDGLCHVDEFWTFNKNLFSSGIPAIEYVLRGLRLYDWRKDSTMPGGAGTHRLADPATWEWTENPTVQRYNYKIGLKGQYAGETILGEGLTQAALDHASYTFSANACDADHPVAGVGTPTYVCGLRAFADRPHSQVLDRFDDAMAGYRVDRAGLDGVIAGAPQVPAFEITDADIRLDDELVTPARRGMAERVNIMTGTFTNPDGLFNADSLDVVRDDAAVLADKRPLYSNINLPQVNNPACAQYVLDVRLRQNRMMASVPALPVGHRLLFEAQPGDWCTWAGKTWLVSGVKCDPPFFKGYLELKETGSSVYSLAGLSPVPNLPGPGVPLPDPGDSTVNGFAVTAGVIAGDDGSSRPALQFYWTPPDDETITGVILEYRKQGGGNWFSIEAPDPESGQYILTNNVASGVVYEARATIRTDPPRVTAYTAILSTATATQSAAVVLAQLQSDVREVLTDVTRRIDTLELQSVPTGFSASSAELGDGFLQRKSIKTVQGKLAAGVTDEQQARIDGDTALAGSLLAVEAKADAGTAAGLFAVDAQAGPTGYDARLAMAVRADNGELFKVAGLFLDVQLDANGGAARAVLVADKILLSDGSEDASPFQFIGSDLVYNGVIRSADNKFRIDGAAGQIVIED